MRDHHAMKTDSGVDRRAFLTGIASAGAGVAVSAASAAPAAAAGPQSAPMLGPIAPQLAAAETADPASVAPVDRWHVANPGSDYMQSFLKQLGYTYVTCMPGSTFRGIHESIINYGMNTQPEMLSVVHEEISAAMAHGYAKMAGKPMAILIHSTVGLQHASMAIYNAYADRVPMLILVGNIADSSKRRPGVEWFHTATDVAAMVRGFIKHDTQPLSLQSFGEEIVKAHAISLTPPYGPVLLTVDGELAENPMESTPVAMPPYARVQPPVADPAALAKVATLLVNAQQPVIFADRVATSAETMAQLVQLAELLQVPVIDSMNRPNFPNTHHLYSSFASRQLVAQADVILALDADDLFSLVGDVPDLVERKTVLRIKPGTKVINIASLYSLGDGNFQDQQRFYQADMAIAGESAASLPYLIDAVNRAMTSERRSQNAQREAHFRSVYEARRSADLRLAAIAWDSTPITVPRLSMELWNAIKDDGDAFSLVSDCTFESSWPQRLWTLDKYHHTNGGSGAFGVGYGMPAAVGAALAARDQGRYSVNIQGDGDLLCSPGSLWTLAHHTIPLLTVVHNNRAWHQELMHVQRTADRRQRNPDRAHIGTVITDPAIDYARVAEGFGVAAEGPITNPADLAPAFARALKTVKSGKPALVDVVAQGR